MITFEELGLEEQLVKATSDLGFVNPTAIQEKAIPALINGAKDLIGLAQTGTGKTAAFGLPLLQMIDKDQKYPQALVICPTRELCLQIVKEITAFKKYLPTVNIVAVYGGSSIGLQIKDLKRGAQIVVATPGRLIDLIERKAIHLEEIKYVIMDEADEMLNMGFQDDIEFILQNTPIREYTWLFSATMPNEIRRVTKKYMSDPIEITVGAVNTTNKNIEHQYYMTSAAYRYETLKRLIDYNPGIYGIIFTRTKMDAQNIAEKLTREGYNIDALHGDLSQPQRDKVMKAFRDKSLQLLIATDVAARGIDVQGITHVINYELPDDVEVYTHRSGRTGRAGLTGVSLSIIHSREVYKLRQIEKIVKAPFLKMEIPSGTEVCRKQFLFFMDKLLNLDIETTNLDAYMPMLIEKFADVSKEEILKRLSVLEFDRFLKYYENATDLNIRDDRGRNQRNTRDSRDGGRDGRNRGERSEGRSRERFPRNEENSDMAKLFVNLGTKDGFYKASFLQYILDLSDLKKEVLGRIDMREMNSWVEIDKKAANKMIKAIDGKNYKGRRIRMNDANSRG